MPLSCTNNTTPYRVWTTNADNFLPKTQTSAYTRMYVLLIQGRATCMHHKDTRLCGLSKSYIGAFLPVQSVSMPIFEGLFASAKCPHAHI